MIYEIIEYDKEKNYVRICYYRNMLKSYPI